MNPRAAFKSEKGESLSPYRIKCPATGSSVNQIIDGLRGTNHLLYVIGADPSLLVQQLTRSEERCRCIRRRTPPLFGRLGEVGSPLSDLLLLGRLRLLEGLLAGRGEQRLAENVGLLRPDRFQGARRIAGSSGRRDGLGVVVHTHPVGLTGRGMLMAEVFVENDLCRLEEEGILEVAAKCK